jgi:major vault protein
MFFEENGMHVYDVEVLSVNIGDTQIQNLLRHAQHEAVESSIEIARNERRLDSTRRQEELQRQELQARAETAEFQSKLETDKIALQLQVAMAKIAASIERSQQELEQQKHSDAVDAARTEAEIAREQARADSALEIFKAKEEVRLSALAAEAQATISQLQALQPGFAEALLALSNQETLVKVAEAMSVQQFVGGKNLPDVVAKVFAGTPLESLSELMMERAATQALPKSNGTRSRKKNADA